jgi:hypothetical protein
MVNNIQCFISNHFDIPIKVIKGQQEFNSSKTQIFRYIQTLLELEYIKQVGGFANKGIKYKISYWDNYQKLRAEIKDFLMLQIEQLRQKQK